MSLARGQKYMKTLGKKFLVVMLTTIFLCSTGAYGLNISTNSIEAFEKNYDILNGQKIQKFVDEDIDPNTNLKITVSITEVRALDDFEKIGGPDFYFKIFIEDEMFESNVWNNQKYLYGDPYLFQATADIPDNQEFVNVTIQLWDKQLGLDRLCDLSNNREYFANAYDIDMYYNTKTGHWDGEDYLYQDPVSYSDKSGYGRLCGTDDGSIYENDRDCELWFEITQSDTDGDGIPYWTEVNEFGTDPMVNDTGRDDDEDGVPIEWEFKWGYTYRYNWHEHTIESFWMYDPFVWENHSSFDPEQDGLDNVEEYMTSQWGSDPFRKDIFVELDQMEAGPDGQPASVLPEGAKELLKTPFDRRNIVYHLDDGCMGGGEMIPFIEFIEWHSNEMYDVYNASFLHGDENNWRRGVFFWGAVLYDANYSGYNFEMGAWQISAKWIDRPRHQIQKIRYGADVVYASVYMHEHGHSLGLNGDLIYGHDTDSYYPWQPNYWKFRPYYSCMNYGYTYAMVDFSDGSRGKNDQNDWANMDLTLFQKDI